MKLTNTNRVILFTIIGLCVISIIYRLIPQKIIPQKVTLQLDLWQADDPVIQALILKFEEQNPDIIIVPTGRTYSGLRESLLNPPPKDAEAEKDKKTVSPDLVMLDMDWLPGLLENDTLVSLEGFPRDDPDLAMMYESSKIDGESHAIPLFSDMYVFFYNIDVLKAAGFDRPPKDRDEFLRYARTLKDKSIYGIGMALSEDNHFGMLSDIYSWFWDSGISFFRDGKPQFTARPVQETITFLNTLSSEGLISPGSFTKSERAKIDEFASGRTAMMIASLPVIHEIGPKVTFEWGISSVPSALSYIGKPLFVTESFGMGIYGKSEHKDEAWKFISFLAAAGINGELASGFYCLPKNQNAKASFISENPQFEKTITLFNTGEGINEFDPYPLSNEAEKIIRDELQAMMAGGQTPDAAAKNIQATWEALLK